MAKVGPQHVQANAYVYAVPVFRPARKTYARSRRFYYFFSVPRSDERAAPTVSKKRIDDAQMHIRC